MSAPFKASPSEYNQHVLFPSNVFTLLADDPECPVYKALFEQIDTSELEKKYSTLANRLTTCKKSSLRWKIEPMPLESFLSE